MPNPFVFIVGSPRSGTTLFRHIVDAHPQITITPEAHWIPRFFEERRGLTLDGFVTPALMGELLENPKFAHFHIRPEDLSEMMPNGHPKDYASFLTEIFNYYGKAQGKSIVGNKTPDSARRIRTLHELWPRARFVHMIRDGRDVALSFMNWSKVLQKKPGNFPTWKEDPVSTAALWWELNVRCGLQGRKILPLELYCEMRYESLVRNPAAECQVLCNFLGLPYDEAMLRFHERGKEITPGAAADPAWRPITPGLRDWRTQMTAEDVERFEAAAGDLLEELGYPRAFPRPGSKSVREASKVRNLLAWDLHKLSLPKVPVHAAP